MNGSASRIAITTALLAVPPTYFVTEHAEQLLRTRDDFAFRLHPLAAEIAAGTVSMPVSPALRLPGSYAARSRLASAALPVQAVAVIAARPDLIHQHHGVWTAGAVTAARALRVPLVTTVHGTDMRVAALPAPRGLQKVHRAQARLAFARSARILAVSEHLRDIAMRAGATASQVQVHYQGVNTDTFVPPTRRLSQDGLPTLLYAGRLSAQKGVDRVIAASLALHAHVPHRLEIVGDGPLRERLEQAAREHPSVTFHGALDRAAVLERMQQADVLALASDQEAAGLVLLEAQSCGVPVVVTGGDGKAEMLRAGETGTVVAPDADAETLARAIADWFPDCPRGREQIAERTRDFVVRERSVRSGATQLAAHYEELLG